MDDILLRKIKKSINILNIIETIGKFFVTWVIISIIITLPIAILSDALQINDNIAIGITIIISTLITILIQIANHQQRTQDEAIKLADTMEYNVNKTVHMEVVHKKENISKHGNTVRELLFKDPDGRVVTYESGSYSHKNINTVFYAVEESKSYDIEWYFTRYDTTGKKHEYYNILKIDGKDVDLNT
jgi:hypothetical protein